MNKTVILLAAGLPLVAAAAGGEAPNDQDYDRDLRVHELTLEMAGVG